MPALFYPDQELFKVSRGHRIILAKEAQTGDNERPPMCENTKRMSFAHSMVPDIIRLAAARAVLKQNSCMKSTAAKVGLAVPGTGTLGCT